MGLPTTGTLSFSQINECVRFTNGNVGINTTNPLSALDVNGAIQATGITVANLNITGAIYQNGSTYQASQWTSTSGNVSYTSGSVVATNLQATNASATSLAATNVTATRFSAATLIASTGITTGDVNITGNLYQNGALYSASQWTTTSGNVSYTSGSVVATNIVSTAVSTGVLLATTGITSGPIRVSGESFFQRLNATSTSMSSLSAVNITTGAIFCNSVSLPNFSSTNITTTSLFANNITSSTLTTQSITTGSISAISYTGSNLSLSGNLNIAGTLTAVNVTTTNLVDTNISAGTLTASGLSALTNVTSTNQTTAVLIATTGITTAGLAATTITGANLSLSGGITCATLNVNTLFTNMSGANATFTNITAGGLRVTGALQFANLSTNSIVWKDSAGTDRSKIYDDAQFHILTDDNLYFDIGGSITSANTMMFMNGTGLGIATTTPRSVLDVNGNMIINSTMYFGGTYAQANNGPRITENWGVTLVANGTNQPVRVTGGALLVGYGGNGANFGTNANLLVSSNVGIGTTTASYRLSINTTGDTPSINPDAYNSLIVAEDMSGAAVRSGTLAGSAIYNRNTGGTTGYVQLTDAAVNQNGQYYWNFNPGNAFTADWEAQTTGAGEDLVFFWGATSAPPTNAGSGARGDSSYSIEFDHANDIVRLFYDSTQLTTASQAIGNSASWFKFRVVYQRNTIRVYYNNTLIINFKDTARSLNLSNSFTGFTSWTSATNSAHRIRDIRIQKFTEGLWSYQSQTSANIMFNGGNVGIGTTNPSRALHVWSNNTAPIVLVESSAAQTNLSLRNTNSNGRDWYLNSDNNGMFNIYDNNAGATRLTINTQGNVGIGATAPSYLLDVNSSVNFAVRLVGSALDAPVIRYENTNAAGGTFHVGSTASGSGAGRGFSIFDVTNSASRMLIGSGGNVGFGTTSPAYRLDVNGSTMIRGSLFSTSVPASTTAIPLPKAAARFAWNGSSMVVTNSYNCSISRFGTGQYAVTFTNALPDTNYIITTGFQRVGTADFLQYYGLATGGFNIEFFSGGNITDNPNIMSFCVY